MRVCSRSSTVTDAVGDHQDWPGFFAACPITPITLIHYRSSESERKELTIVSSKTSRKLLMVLILQLGTGVGRRPYYHTTNAHPNLVLVAHMFQAIRRISLCPVGPECLLCGD